jgi:hypothetical protein
MRTALLVRGGRIRRDADLHRRHAGRFGSDPWFAAGGSTTAGGSLGGVAGRRGKPAIGA